MLTYGPQLVIFVNQAGVAEPAAHGAFEAVQLGGGQCFGNDAVGGDAAQRGHQAPVVAAMATEHQLHARAVEEVAFQQQGHVTPAFQAGDRDAATQLIGHHLEALGLAVGVPARDSGEVVAGFRERFRALRRGSLAHVAASVLMF